MHLRHRFRLFALLGLSLSLAQVRLQAHAQTQAQKELIPRQAPASTEYTLGPGDQVTIRVVDLEEFADRSVRIDPNGFVDLPMIGRIQAGGQTIDQLKETLAAKLSRYINEPQVTLNLSEIRTRLSPSWVRSIIPGYTRSLGQDVCSRSSRSPAAPSRMPAQRSSSPGR